MNYPKFDSFHKRLLWAMEKEGINKRQLSIRIGVASNAISWLITHQRLPKPENLLKISKVLKVDHLWLSVGSANDTPPDYSDLKDRLEWAIKRKGISITRLGQKIGMTGSPIRRMIRKKIDPHPSSIMKLSKALQVDYMWLYKGYNKQATKPILPKERLKYALLQKGYSITQFAKVVNVSQPTVSQWINGNVIPRTKQRKIIARLLSQEESWLFEGIAGWKSIKFNQRFLIAINKQGLSPEDLAKKMKSSPKTIIRYTKGAIPNRSKWEQLSRHLQVEKDWLFTEFDPRRKKKRYIPIEFNNATWARFRLAAQLVGVTTDKYLQLFMGWSAVKPKYFSKKKSMQYNTILSLAVSFGVQVDWLLFGKGDMIIPNGYYPIENLWRNFPERMLYLAWSRSKVSPTQLAKQLGVTKQTIFNYKSIYTHYTPDDSKIKKIAKSYQVPVNWLIKGTYSDSFYNSERRLILRTFPGLKNNIFNTFKNKTNGHIRVKCEKGKWKFIQIRKK
ncbi:MAG: helix-turn-helix transcriptional regulator [Cyclobacteriaceae bacterium]